MGRVSWRPLLGVLAVILAPLAAHDAASAAVVQPIRYDDSALASVGQATWRDFNGDGQTDLAVGAPYDDVSGQAFAGVVHVFYGTANGLTVLGSKVISQATPGVQGTPEFGDHFGWSLTSADFNNDGFGDLAVGVPHEDVKVNGVNRVDVGVVQILYGGIAGPPAAGDALISPTSFLDVSEPTQGGEFGYALAALDSFKGADGRPDLAVGSPGNSSYYVIDGHTLPPAFANQVGARVDTSDPDARFGEALAAGDFDSNGRDDLAIANPNYGAQNRGRVAVYLNGGPFDGGTQLLFEAGISGLDFNPNDHAGRVLGARDLDGDGFDELVIAAPDHSVDGKPAAGIVWVIPSTQNGPSCCSHLFITLGTVGIAATEAANDRLGSALAFGRFNAGAVADIAIGVPGRDILGASDAGAVLVLYDEEIANLWSQATKGIEGVPELNDRFGSALSAGNWGFTGRADLAVGVPREGISGQPAAGVVNVLYSAASGLASANNEILHQDLPGVGEEAENLDRFGLSLR
jgi:hypothetical protein